MNATSTIVFFSGTVRPRATAWKHGVVGGLAIFCAVVFAAGAFDRNVREQLGGVLIGSLVAAVVLASLWWKLRRSAGRQLSVGLDHAGPFVRIEGGPELRAPLSYHLGWYPEIMDAGTARATVAVLWVSMEGRNGGPITVRKGLGAAFVAPDGWKPSSLTTECEYALLTIEALPQALELLGAARKGQNGREPIRISGSAL